MTSTPNHPMRDLFNRAIQTAVTHAIGTPDADTRVAEQLEKLETALLTEPSPLVLIQLARLAFERANYEVITAFGDALLYRQHMQIDDGYGLHTIRGLFDRWIDFTLARDDLSEPEKYAVHASLASTGRSLLGSSEAALPEPFIDMLLAIEKMGAKLRSPDLLLPKLPSWLTRWPDLDAPTGPK